MAEQPEKKVPRRLGPFRMWEVVVIAIAIVLFIVAAFAGPSQPPPEVAAPTGSPGPVVSGPTPMAGTPSADSSAAAATPTPTVTALIPRDEQGRTGSPVATLEQVLVDQVGDYVLTNRGLSESDVRGGSLESTELRYSTTPQDDDTDIFHGVEVHLDAQAARERVEDFGEELVVDEGYEIFRRQSLRSPGGDVQGAYLELRNGSQRLLLWSNRNVVFSLGGGADADLDAFYDRLPY